MDFRGLKKKRYGIDLYVLSNLLFERLRESSNRCFLFVEEEITYFFTNSYEEWNGWAALAESKNLCSCFIEENKDEKIENGFYEVNGKNFSREYFYWSKMTNEDGNKKAGIRLGGIKTDLKILRDYEWKRFFLEIESIDKGDLLYSINNVTEIRFLSEMHRVQSLIPRYFGGEVRYIDLDIFLFLSGYSTEDYSCWISEDYNLPIIFRENDDINSEVIALLYPIKL